MTRSQAMKSVEEHRPALTAYLRRMSGDPALAEDLCQETFLRALGRAERYEERQRARAWLFTIARNLLFDHWRRRARRPPRQDALDPSRLAIDPMQHLSASLGEALMSIDERERDAFLLRELGGLGYREIAEVTGATPGAARSRIHRARLALRERLSAPLTRVRRRAPLKEIRR